jgi:hypothetical protein
MIFLADRARYTQRTLLREIHGRLQKQPGCENVRHQPSSRRPRYVHADIDPTAFLSESYGEDHARLEIRFWYPQGVSYEYYRINWVEPSRGLMLGFHQDGDHPDLDRCHIQLDHEESTVNRHRATFYNHHPMAILEERLQQLPDALAAIQWQNRQPSLPKWP